ncbi:Adenosine deaminase [Chitinispirillum alkaliphilum]|nr:Adenosine deaminase [Chitinispirillum alkaliphilum]
MLLSLLKKFVTKSKITFLGRIAVVTSVSIGAVFCGLSQNIDEKYYQLTEQYFESLVSSNPVNSAALRQFLTAMPKGGDLHHHYSGAIYTETYLEWVKKNNWYIESQKLKIRDSACVSCITVDSLRSNNQLYMKLLASWSNKDYGNYFDRLPPDQQFFNTFSYFSPVSAEYMHLGLESLQKRAEKENVSYIETMLSKVGVTADSIPDYQMYDSLLSSAADQQTVDSILAVIDSVCLTTPHFKETLENFVGRIDSSQVNIDTNRVRIRYQTYASRTSSPLQVYIDLLSGFKAADTSDLIVGVNIVGPENNFIALRDYTLHMMFFNYLKRNFPDVKKSLHAGELTIGMVEPEQLVFHMNEAVHIAGAQRIGHGVSLPYEFSSFELVEKLRNDSIAIEINFTSNEFILGVKDNDHPYRIYSMFNVPMVISTDDPGVSRNNLSDEYLLLVTRYKPSYEEVKSYVYNSIIYSFLEDHEKDYMLRDLDQRFSEFEKMIANIML